MSFARANRPISRLLYCPAIPNSLRRTSDLLPASTDRHSFRIARNPFSFPSPTLICGRALASSARGMAIRKKDLPAPFDSRRDGESSLSPDDTSGRARGGDCSMFINLCTKET